MTANNAVAYSPIQVADQNLQLIQANISKCIAQLQSPKGGFSYTPGTPSSWASPAPISLQSALDRMAALLKTLNSGNPIP